MRPMFKIFALVTGVVLLAGHPGATEQAFDLLIRGGRIVDGTGAASRVADVGITAATSLPWAR